MRRPERRRLPRYWWAAPLTAGVALLGAAAWGVAVHQPQLPAAGPAPVLALPPTSASPHPAGAGAARPTAVQPSGQATKGPVAVSMPAVLPVGASRVSVPSLDVTAPVIPESVSDGQLGVPANPAELGWWMPTTAELVIDGHVDTAATGPGALFRVSALHPGAEVAIATGTGAGARTEHWTIDGVRTYRKGTVPATLFDSQSPRLLIITCGGPFDYATRHYQDNVVAYASPKA